MLTQLARLQKIASGLANNAGYRRVGDVVGYGFVEVKRCSC